MRRLLLSALLAASLTHAQSFSTPPTFRLVTPQGPGSITVNLTGGWEVERFVLYDKGARAVLLLKNDTAGIDMSYILSNDLTFDYNKESCKDDVLGSIMGGPLKKATVKNKSDSIRALPTGQPLDVASYLIARNEGIALNQQNVFGFIAHDHTCAEIHLSRTPFRDGEDHLFDPALNSFSFDPSYTPTAEDYKLMAKLLPPGMASAYTSPGASQATTAVPAEPAQSLTFALPNHPGYLHMDAPNYVVTELSAKPNGHEFGIRAKDPALSGAEALGFLFVTSPPEPTAVACRDWMLNSEKSGVKNRKILKTYEQKSDSGVPIALVDYEQTKAPAADRFVRRFFVAQGDLCADIAITAANELMAQTSSSLLSTLTFDPTRAPDFMAKFRYATVLYDHHAYAAAAPLYVEALSLVPPQSDSLQWTRVLTDQASMAYGISGDLPHSRAVNEAAIARDPGYPLYYYNLACADAEAGNATAARTHLEQAYARRANTIKGETMPDASKDDSILKLKSNAAFWAFVQTLPKS